MRRVALGALAATALSSVLVVGVPSEVWAVPDGDGCVGLDDAERTEKEPPTEGSAPLDKLQIEEAQDIVRKRTGGAPGAGVRVAVVDSGVSSPGVTVQGKSRTGTLVFYHGTAMAGVIAGKAQPGGVGLIGIAPGATVYDARVYDSTNKEDGITPSESTLVAGLKALVPLVGRGAGDINIVNVSLTLAKKSDRLEAAVKEVTDAGAIVVASSGNRVPETSVESDDDESDNSYDYGEDVTSWPAGYAATNPLVVSVGTLNDETEDPGTPSGLLSSTIDVVVPTFGAVSYSINGSTCSFYQSSTSVAAAEVSGILALLRSGFPDDTPAQLIARLEATATGGSPTSSGAVDKFRGRGVVQPVEALTRPLRPDKSGVIPSGSQQQQAVSPAALPRSEPDVLRGTRRNAVWWGLFGGGALVVALLLRPVLSRRRTTR